MASSPVEINQATFDELLTLRDIGPRRASRILAYRAEVGDINNAYDLALAAGLGLKQASRVAESVAWPRAAVNRAALAVAAIAMLGAYLLAFFGLADMHLDTTRPELVVYNLAIVLIVSACLILSAEQIGRFFGLKITFYLVIVAVALGLAGFVSVTGLVIWTWLELIESELSVRTQATLSFVSFSLLIAYIINAPTLHMQHINLKGPAGVTNIQLCSTVYDAGQLLLAILALTVLVALDSGFWIEEIFALWASLVLLMNSYSLWRGQSAFVAMLSAHDRSVIEFLFRQTDEKIVPTPWPMMGLFTGALSVLLVIVAVSGILWR